jgi:phage shock protein PspC (stress-responsive transcriptional regulator)
MRLALLALLSGIGFSAHADMQVYDGIDPPLMTYGLVLIGGLMALTALVAYIWCLVNAAKNGKWVWFVLMIFFQLLFIFYLLFADKRPSSPRHRETS